MSSGGREVIKVVREQLPEVTKTEFEAARMGSWRAGSIIEQYVQQRNEHGEIDQPENNAEDGVDSIFRKIVV